MLLRLAGPGEGDAVVRRRAPLQELVALEVPGVSEVVEKLATARLVTLSEGRAEVAHEALFRDWPRLRSWLADDVTSRDLFRRLTADAADWDAPAATTPPCGAVPGCWPAPRARARRDEVTAREREFLAAAQERADAEQRGAEQRAAATASQNRRLRRLLAGLALLLVVALLAGGLAWRAQREAPTPARPRTRNGSRPPMNEDYLDLALLSAVEAVRAERSPETTGALLTLLSRLPDVLTQVRSRTGSSAARSRPIDARCCLGERAGPAGGRLPKRWGTALAGRPAGAKATSASVSPDGSPWLQHSVLGAGRASPHAAPAVVERPRSVPTGARRRRRAAATGGVAGETTTGRAHHGRWWSPTERT